MQTGYKLFEIERTCSWEIHFRGWGLHILIYNPHCHTNYRDLKPFGLNNSPSAEEHYSRLRGTNGAMPAHNLFNLCWWQMIRSLSMKQQINNNTCIRKRIQYREAKKDLEDVYNIVIVYRLRRPLIPWIERNFENHEIQNKVLWGFVTLLCIL